MFFNTRLIFTLLCYSFLASLINYLGNNCVCLFAPCLTSQGFTHCLIFSLWWMIGSVIVAVTLHCSPLAQPHLCLSWKLAHNMRWLTIMITPLFFFFNYSWMCDESWEYDMTYIWFFARNVYLKNKSINSLLPRQIGRRKMPLPVRFIDIYLKGQCHAIWVEFQ